MPAPWERYRTRDQSSYGVQTRPADPMQPANVRRANNAADASDLDPAIAAANLERIRAETERERLATERARLEAAQGNRDDRLRMTNMDALASQLVDVERQFRQNVQGGAPWWLGGILPTSENNQFNRAGEQLLDVGAGTFRNPGQGSQDQREFEAKRQSYVPRTTNTDSENQQIFGYLRMRVDAERRAQGLEPFDWEGRINGQQPQDMPGAGGMDRTQQRIMNPGAQARELGDGSTTLQEDPVLRGVAARLGGMIAQGAPDGEILRTLREAGVPPDSTSVREVLRYRRTPAFQEWRRQNPNSPYPFSDNFFTREVPQSGTRATFSGAANSPGGAFVANAADSITAGSLDNIAGALGGNAEQFRAGLGGLREQNPLSSLAGSIGGAALGAGGLEAGIGAALTRAGLPAGINAMRGADALYGASYGAGSADYGNRGIGALTGAATGGLGGVAGRALTRGASRGLTGARDEATRFLTARNVPLTVGQIAGRGGLAGRAFKSIEDRLESLPILGDAIRTRRAQGTEAFNREAFNEALAPIGQRAGTDIGERGVEAADASVSGAYSQALQGVRVQADNNFVTDMRRAIDAGARLPGTMADEFRYVISERIAPELDGGAMTGDGFQALRQTLRQERQAMRGQPRGKDYGNALRQVEGALDRLVRRQRPEVVQSLNAADQAYRRTRVVANAVERGKNTGGTFTPSQLGTAASQNARRFDGSQSTTARPFFDLQRNAQEVLPSTTPNSGTVDRAWVTAALPAAVGAGAAATDYVSPQQGALFAALGIPFTRAGQAAFQKLLVSRPEVVRRAGEMVLRQQQLGGAAGTGVGATMIGYGR